MALKFNLQVSQQDIDDAKNRKSQFQKYGGPTPPVGFYHFKLTKLWSGENKDGTAVLIASFVIDEEGENATYNGFSILHRMALPMDPGHERHSMRVQSMDDFFRAISDGSYTIEHFQADAAAGRIQEDGEANKMGTPIKQIGKLKLGQERKVRAKIEHNGAYTNIHYFDLDGVKKKDEDDESPWEGSESGSDSELDDLLGDL